MRLRQILALFITVCVLAVSLCSVTVAAQYKAPERITPPASLAANVTGAEYRTDVRYTNAGAAMTNEIGTFPLSSPDMIAAGMLDTLAEDLAMLTGTGGSNIKVMPGVNATYPWCSFIAVIDAAASLEQSLYTGSVTGGEITYMPGPAGATISDNASRELGANWTLEFNAWLNTTAG